MAWDASPSPNVTSYVVYRGAASGNYTYSTNVTSGTSVSIGGLQSGQTYVFAVAARDAAGMESPPSNEVIYQVPSAVPPTIALTAPANGAGYTAPATINCAATVTANGNAITKVQFYNGSALLGEDSSSPYSYAWSNVGAGSYSLTARVVYGAGSTLSSAAANVSVTNLASPSIALTSPANGASYTAPATVNCAASVTANGQTIAKVQFYSGSTLLGEDTSAPYSVSWNNVGTGNYSLTAKAVYGTGSTVTSAAANVAVTSLLPTITLSAPINGETYAAPATINCAAIVTANGQTITKVQFYSGSTLLGEDTSAPYNHIWSNVASGSYSLTAKAVYGSGSTVVSAPAVAIVGGAPTGMVAAYGFEEESGSDVTDVSANGKNGILTSGAIRTATGQFGQAVEFSGSGGRVDLGGLDIPGSALTIACWIRADSLGANDSRLVSKATGLYESDHYWMVSSISSDGFKPRMRLKTTSGDTSTLIGTVNLSAGVWTHVAATYDGATMSLFVNGQPAGSMAKTGVIVQNPAAPAAIGEQPQGGESFDGSIDEVRIYSVALTPAEIQAIMATPLASPGGSTPQPPAIALTSPADGASYVAPAMLNLAATVTANGHTITKVQFYRGSTLLGEDTSSPYTYAWSNVGAGSYSLTARVVYDSGSTVTSAAANVAVANPPPTIALTSPPAGASYTAPASISLAASVTDNGYAITKVQFYNGSALLGESVSAPYSLTWNNVSVGNYTVTARALYGSGGVANSAPINVAVTALPTLPAPWQAANIGVVALPGNASAANGVYTVQGYGNLAAKADTFHFVYQPLSGHGDITARINSMTTNGVNRCVGVMIRESLAPNSRYAFAGIGQNLKFRWQRRSTTGGSTSSTTSTLSTPPNAWARVVRTNNTLTGYTSADGITWKKLTSANITMAGNIYVGLVVASGNTNAVNTAVFSNVTAAP